MTTEHTFNKNERYRFTDNKTNRDMRIVGEKVTVTDVKQADGRTQVVVEYDQPTVRDSTTETVTKETFAERVENGGLEQI